MAGPGCPCVSLCAGGGEELSVEAGTEVGIGLSPLTPTSQPGSTQEPGSNAEIKEFAAGYNVKFDLFSKICVNGDDAHPLWKWMKVQPKGRGMLGK